MLLDDAVVLPWHSVAHRGVFRDTALNLGRLDISQTRPREDFPHRVGISWVDPRVETEKRRVRFKALLHYVQQARFTNEVPCDVEPFEVFLFRQSGCQLLSKLVGELVAPQDQLPES